MAQVRNPLPSIERLRELFQYKDGALFYKKEEFVQLARDMVHGSFANHGLAI